MAALAVVVIGLPVAVAFRRTLFGTAWGIVLQVRGRSTISERIEQYGAAARGRLRPAFAQASLPYPPCSVVLAAFKQERLLELWAAGNDGDPPVFVRSYPILGASGHLGPKLEEGDGQVPEGVYRIESLNPNSRFHLSLRLNYPNEFDRLNAREDGREHPGSDIMIHGKTASIGCLAMGDEAAEDLFVLAHDTGIDRLRVILSPVDFRVRSLPPGEHPLPPWTTELYALINAEFQTLRK